MILTPGIVVYGSLASCLLRLSLFSPSHFSFLLPSLPSSQFSPISSVPPPSLPCLSPFLPLFALPISSPHSSRPGGRWCVGKLCVQSSRVGITNPFSDAAVTRNLLGCSLELVRFGFQRLGPAGYSGATKGPPRATKGHGSSWGLLPHCWVIADSTWMEERTSPLPQFALFLSFPFSTGRRLLSDPLVLAIMAGPLSVVGGMPQPHWDESPGSCLPEGLPEGLNPRTMLVPQSPSVREPR